MSGRTVPVGQEGGAGVRSPRKKLSANLGLTSFEPATIVSAVGQPVLDLPPLAESQPEIPGPPLISKLKTSRSFYQPELDSLRFLAFLGVFCYHCIPSEAGFYRSWPHSLVPVTCAAIQAGGLGVPVFFALSAYLITNLLLREKESRGVLDTRGFYIRRMLRIWPLYFVFVAFAAVLPLVARSQSLSFAYISGFLLLAGNWVYAFIGPPVSVAGPLWSVSIEEQFYLAWPLVVRRASRASIAKIAIGLVIAANASRVLLVSVGANPQAVSFNTISRIDPIALGVLLALVLKDSRRLRTWTRASLLLGSIGVLIGIQFWNLSTGWGDIAGNCLAAFASVGILAAFVGAKNSWIRHPVLLYLGKISYGLYVIHLFGWFCAAHILREQPRQYQMLAGRLELALLAFVITILAAALSYRWLESPFLRLKERFTHVRSRPV